MSSGLSASLQHLDVSGWNERCRDRILHVLLHLARELFLTRQLDCRLVQHLLNSRMEKGTKEGARQLPHGDIVRVLREESALHSLRSNLFRSRLLHEPAGQLVASLHHLGCLNEALVAHVDGLVDDLLLHDAVLDPLDAEVGGLLYEGRLVDGTDQKLQKSIMKRRHLEHAVPPETPHMLHGTILEQVTEAVFSFLGSHLLQIILGVDHALEHGQLARFAGFSGDIIVSVLFDQFI